MKIAYVPEIVNDLANARDWYESRADGLGEEFLRMAYAAFEELIYFPEKHEVVYGSYRRALLRRFPYSVYYIAHPHSITVYGVFHTSRNPRFVTKKLVTR
jgi:plasmid stabilization system protein ParE